MTTRVVTDGATFPDVAPQYDVQNERQFRRTVTQQLQTISTQNQVSQPFYDVTDFGNAVGKGFDDTTAVKNAITAVSGLGGGQLLIPNQLLIAADISMPRSVMPVGLGPTISQIKSTGSQRRWKVTGIPSVTNTAGDLHLTSGITFDAVSVDYGPTPSDQGRGAVTAFCEFVNSDRAIYYGYNTFNTKIVSCNFRQNVTHVYYDFATVGSGSGAHMCISDSVLSECSGQALYMNGSTADGYHIWLTNIITDTAARFLTAVNVTTDGLLSIKNISFEGVTDCFIYNEGANVYVDGFMALTGTENYWVYQNGTGFVYFKNGRGFWNNNKFCRITNGVIVFDQASSFMNGPLWGVGLNQFAHASSSGGKVMAPRAPYQGHFDLAPITINAGTPADTSLIAAVGFDYNDRVWEFDVDCTASGTSNTLRVQLADGAGSPFIDLIFPNTTGGARVRVLWDRAGVLRGSAMYVPAAAGNAQWVSASNGGAATVLAATKTLAFTTTGGSPATIVISGLTEQLMGHQVVGL